jgi:hypothetical protein
MRRFPDFLVGFLAGFAVLLVIFVLSSDFAAHYEICEKTNTGAKECAGYNGLSYALYKIWAALDALNGAITAIATAFIAWFTLSLRQSTDKLWDAGERQLGLLAQTSAAQSKDMQDSVAVAKESAEISRTSLISTQRAYVRVLNFPWLWRGDSDRPGKFFYDITPIVENGGNTQTVDAKINVNSALRDQPLPDDFDFPYKGEYGLTLIGAHQTIGASNAHILDEDLLLVRRGQKFFYIWGTITYRDVFPDTPERVTEFCTQISRVFGNPLDPRETGNPKGTTVEIYFQIYPKHQKTT